jgi:hypothetical protein
VRASRFDCKKVAFMISKVTGWIKNRLFATETRLQLDTKTSETGLAAALMSPDLGEEQSAAITAVIAGLERGVPERELRVIHGDDIYGRADTQYRHQKRISAIITEIGHECDRHVRRESVTPRPDNRFSILEQARAASAYAAAGPLTGTKDKALSREVLWPWPGEEFRPYDSRRNLVVAGAHIIAAIEKLDRVANRAAAHAVIEMAPREEAEEEGQEAGPPPLLFVRNRGMQTERVMVAFTWLIRQQAPLLHIVANNPENLFDVFKKMSAVYQDSQISKMFLDLAHGVHVPGNGGELQPVIASQHFDPIDPKAPLLLLYPSLETLEWVADEHGRTEAPWFIVPWDFEEMAEWLEDHEADEQVLI